MKVVIYQSLCSKRKKNRVHIYCTHKLFKPLVICMGFAIFMFVVNLIVGNFFVNIRASLQHFVNSFVKLFWL